MQLFNEAIIGHEILDEVSTPYSALVQFYNAFNNRNIILMEKSWSNSEDIAMDNPLGGIMRGWVNIKELYLRIFEGKAKVYVEFYEYTLHESSEIFYTVGRERGFFENEDIKIDLAIRTSRIFRKIEGNWRQVHHHGSIDNPELLRTYQNIIKK